MLRLMIVLTLLVNPSSVFAQAVFAPQSSGLKPGQRIRVLFEGACANTPCPPELVKGKITELSAASIVIDDGRGHYEVASNDILLVERPRDGIWNGVLIGFAVGFSIGFVGVLADGCDPGEWCIFDGPEFAAAFGLLSGGIGAGVGAITDAAISHRRLVFARAPNGPEESSSHPWALARGVSFTVRF